jgi:hypothetical protein
MTGQDMTHTEQNYTPLPPVPGGTDQPGEGSRSSLESDLLQTCSLQDLLRAESVLRAVAQREERRQERESLLRVAEVLLLAQIPW